MQFSFSLLIIVGIEVSTTRGSGWVASRLLQPVPSETHPLPRLVLTPCHYNESYLTDNLQQISAWDV